MKNICKILLTTLIIFNIFGFSSLVAFHFEEQRRRDPILDRLARDMEASIGECIREHGEDCPLEPLELNEPLRTAILEEASIGLHISALLDKDFRYKTEMLNTSLKHFNPYTKHLAIELGKDNIYLEPHLVAKTIFEYTERLEKEGVEKHVIAYASLLKGIGEGFKEAFQDKFDRFMLKVGHEDVHDLF